MSPEDFGKLTLLSVPVLVRADPTTEKRTLLLAQATAEVLTELHLSNIDLTSRYSEAPSSFVVCLGDLNELGLTFARTGYQRWLVNTDRWTGQVTLEKFKEALQKQWSKSLGKAL